VTVTHLEREGMSCPDRNAETPESPVDPAGKGGAPAQKGVLGVFSLAMINLAIIYSVRGLPLMAEEGLRAVSFMVLAAVFFLVPVSLITAELSSTWPPRGPGGVYIWVREALGERWAFLAIWLQWSENVIWFPTVLSFIAATLAYLFDPQLASNKLFTLAVVLVAFWGGTLANLHGIKTSAWVSTLGVISTLVTSGLIVILGAVWIVQGNVSQIPFSLEALVPDFRHMSSLVFLAGALVIVSGIEVSAVHSAQVKNPKRAFPRAILLSVVVSVSAIILGSLSIAVVVPQKAISLEGGIMEAFEHFFSAYHMTWLVPLMALLIVAGSLGELAAWIIGPSKGLLISAHDGVLPPFLRKTNRDHVPVNILLIQAVIVTGLVFVFLLMPTVSSAYWILTALTAQLYVVMYMLLFLSALVLRYTKPNTHRPYRVPGGNVGIWLVAGLGLAGTVFTLVLGFFPPSDLKTGNVIFYESFLSLGILIFCASAVIIHALRKPSWRDPLAGEEE
jgi:glutamate:GABA antiporter